MIGKGLNTWLNLPTRPYQDTPTSQAPRCLQVFNCIANDKGSGETDGQFCCSASIQ